jgi:hypothetical protein
MYNLMGGGVRGERAIHTILIAHLQNCLCAAMIKRSLVQGETEGNREGGGLEGHEWRAWVGLRMGGAVPLSVGDTITPTRQ